MTTYNTGNPIGSTDARDLYDNAKNLDTAMNSTGSTWTDRRGVTRKTFKAAENAADQAEAAANTAVNTTIPGYVASVLSSKNTAVNTTIPGYVSAVESAKNTAINTSIPAAVALVDTAVAETAAGAASAAKVAAEAARDATIGASSVQVPLYSSYSTGLAAVADNAFFAIPSSTGAQVYIYKRVSGKGVLQGARPYAFSNSQEVLAVACRTPQMVGEWPVAPLVDVDSSQANLGARQYQNLAIGTQPTLNILGFGDKIYRGPMVTIFGATISENVADPSGGTTAFRVNASAGSGSLPGAAVFTIKCPPGQYTIAAEYAVASGTADFAIKPDYYGAGGAAVTKTATTTYQTQSVTFELTTETDIAPIFAMAAASPWSDLAIQYINPRIVPGSSAGSAIPSVGNVSRQAYVNALMDGNFFRNSISASAPLAVQFAAKKSFTTMSYLTAFRFDPTTDTAYGLLFGDLNDKYALFTGPGKSALNNSFNFLSNGVGSNMVGATPGEWMVLAVTVGADGTKAYINGFKVHDTARTSVATTQAALLLHDAAAYPFSGLVSGHTVWDVQLTDAQVTTATTVMLNRLRSKGANIGTFKNFLVTDGDSITAGAGTGTCYINQMNPKFTPVLQGRNFATSGARLMDQLAPRQSQALAYVNAAAAAGKRPIVHILIGTNDITASLTTNALVDAYMVNLKAYWAAYRSAGAKLIVGTVGGSQTDPNRTQRDYLNNSIRAASAFYDGLADYAANTNLNNWNTTYMADNVHMSAEGNNLMASILYPVLAPLVLS